MLFLFLTGNKQLLLAKGTQLPSLLEIEQQQFEKDKRQLIREKLGTERQFDKYREVSTKLSFRTWATWAQYTIQSFLTVSKNMISDIDGDFGDFAKACHKPQVAVKEGERHHHKGMADCQM